MLLKFVNFFYYVCIFCMCVGCMYELFVYTLYLCFVSTWYICFIFVVVGLLPSVKSIISIG